MLNKPFCLAVGPDWTLKPPKPAPRLKDIHTDLTWTKKDRKPGGVKQQRVESLTHLLLNEDLGEGPVRILVQGEMLQNPIYMYWAISKTKSTVEPVIYDTCILRHPLFCDTFS